jgi:hypothetical protein
MKKSAILREKKKWKNDKVAFFQSPKKKWIGEALGRVLPE